MDTFKLILVVVLLIGSVLGQSINVPGGFGLYKRLRMVQRLPLNLQQCICPALYKPVCASDGKTYSSACIAKCRVAVRKNIL